MNAGNLRGLGTQFDTQKRSVVAAAGMIIGSYGPPIGPATWSGTTSQPAFNAVNPGNVGFDAPRFCSTGGYTHTLTSGSKFYGSWILNDTIEFVGNGLTGLEMGGLYVRPEIHCNDGQGANETVVGQDIVLTVKGSNTVNQIVTFGPGSIILTNTTNAYGVRPSIQTPDSAGVTIGTVTFFQAVSLKGAGNTYTTLIGLDLSLINTAAATTAWGIQVGTAQNYFAGNSMFGSTSAPSFPVDVTGTARITGTLLWGSAIPTSTTDGLTIDQAPEMAANRSYTATFVSPSDYIFSWLLNDTITFGGNVATSSVYALGVRPKFVASQSRTDETASGLAASPQFTGTDTYSACYGMNLNASVQSAATSVFGISSAIVQTTATTATTVTVFNGQTVRTAGTWTTLVGLNLTSLNGGSTTWGIQVGNYNNYFQGKTAFGGTSTPANTVDIQAGAFNFNVDTMTYAGTISLDVTKGNVHKTTTTSAVGNATINATAATVAGEPLIIIITNDGTANRTITFGSNLHSVSTLVGTTTKTAVVSFISDGSQYWEFARTTGIA